MTERERALEAIRPVILTMHDRMRDAVVTACEQNDVESVSKVAGKESGDTIYAIDRVGEAPLLEYLGAFADDVVPIVVIAEGLAGGRRVLPAGAAEEDAVLRVIVDPIDGTRGLMYQKRSGWVLTGVAPNLGADTGLQDLVLSVMTEIPLIRQHLSDQVWAVKGGGANGIRRNRLDGSTERIHPTPSRAAGIEHGYAGLARLVPGARDILAAIDDELIHRVAQSDPDATAICFEDQYTSTGGQLYELCAGRDRFLADLRSLTKPVVAARGRAAVLCCHPYDLAGLVVARELGVIVTGWNGQPLTAPLDTSSDVSWIGYANESIRRVVEPHLLNLISEHGLDRGGEAGG